MKKIYKALTASMLVAGLLASCAPTNIGSSSVVSSMPPTSVAASVSSEVKGAPRTELRIASLKGPTTMGLVKLMSNADEGTARHDYKVTMYGTADEIAPKLIKGDIDVALLPCNLASVLYNKTKGSIQMAAVNTLGVLYIVETGDSVKTVADLKGKTIYSTGKGTTPEYVLNYVLQENGLVPGTDVQIEYKSEATEVAAAIKAASGDVVAMLPQPYVSTLAMQSENVRVALDMTKEWDKVSPDSQLVTGVVVARREFIEQNPAAFAEFMQDYSDSTKYVNAEVDAAADLVVKYEIVPKAPIAVKAIPACNITFVTGEDMRRAAGGYLEVLSKANIDAIGGALPNEDFYYIQK